jgi:replicative DNA helicase
LSKRLLDIEENDGKAEVIVAKLRQGDTGPVTLPFGPIRQAFGASMHRTFDRMEDAA